MKFFFTKSWDISEELGVNNDKTELVLFVNKLEFALFKLDVFIGIPPSFSFKIQYSLRRNTK